jgi:hypothetical protein
VYPVVSGVKMGPAAYTMLHGNSTLSWMCTARSGAMVAIGQAVVFE